MSGFDPKHAFDKSSGPHSEGHRYIRGMRGYLLRSIVIAAAAIGETLVEATSRERVTACAICGRAWPHADLLHFRPATAVMKLPSPSPVAS